MHSHAAVALFVRRILLRSVVSPGEVQALSGLEGRRVQASRGQDLVLPGHGVHHATLLVSGLLARFDQMADGRRQITALHIPGDMADLHSVPMPLPAWGIQALVPSVVLQIPHGDLRGLAERKPAIAMAFWRDTVADASILAKWTANLGRADAVTRTAHLICEMGMRMEAHELDQRHDFALPITQAQLADALGLTTVHVNRTVSTLRQECGVLFEQGRVRVGDWTGLVRRGNFDDGYLMLDVKA
ncbi:Crp/Fnr family transcriptional regulator [Novosphingobium lindaniclasticum]|uniref:HTH crp-type domain-containing protein n=1 Tax=Novosphingobium lindaniclasticum LE124 TaxID=1096930 RepID=T0HAE4_9SPHN|nr:helix-turn-helix domain-containing protein [Novosphingobium lindaniclasticum]EQB09992.1 hypothetical protein L284_18040 [Novosphingobium lindaniclasticum LE124]